MMANAETFPCARYSAMDFTRHLILNNNPERNVLLLLSHFTDKVTEAQRN